MGWHTEGVRKVYGGTVQEKLCQDRGRWLALEKFTGGLYLCHSVHEIWDQSAPHLLRDEQDLLEILDLELLGVKTLVSILIELSLATDFLHDSCLV